SRTFLTFMRLMLIYVIVKGAYNFLFVPLLHQGHWYYSLSITIINVAGAVVLIQHWRRWSVGRPTMRRLLIPVAAVAAALSIALFIHDRQTQAIANDYVAFFERGPAIAERLTETMSDPRIVEVDDGIVNFALALPTMSGFLFAIDPDAYAAYQAGGFLTAASRRGYQLIGSLYYLRSVTADDLSPETIPDTLRERVFNATDWDLDKFDFELAYWDKPTGAVFIRFTPKP
ncbi:MAG: hypothetical protein MJE12_29830, partial [Alphaproteobacteria bacterium]|nr:hypothetical protein [Alphaproteobacteria bacterium]